MTEADINSVIKIMPDLGYDGNGVDWHRGELRDEMDTRRKFEQDYLKGTSPMLSLVAVWCSAVKRIKTIDRQRTSYTYKHDVERDFGHYVANGQFIAAAIFCGIKYKERRDSINVFFAMPKCGRKYDYDRNNMARTLELPGEPAEWWDAIRGRDGEMLWRNVIASPNNYLPRGVLADWLDENNLPHWGHWMRMVGHESLQQRHQFA